MKVILVGYPGSQRIGNASAYLVNKYLPFEVTHIEHAGEVTGWANFVADILKLLDDKYIIFALDDYLLSAPIEQTEFDMGDAVLAKLCKSTPQENEEYPVTTQYTVWDREYLISLLKQVSTPWEFEIKGSQLFKESGKKALFLPVLDYYTNSSLSNRWEGVRLEGLNEEDIKEVQNLL